MMFEIYKRLAVLASRYNFPRIEAFALRKMEKIAFKVEDE